MNQDESNGARGPSPRAILGLLPLLLAATGGMVLMEPRHATALDAEPDGENGPSPFSAEWAEQAADKILDMPVRTASLGERRPVSPHSRSRAERKARNRSRRARSRAAR